MNQGITTGCAKTVFKMLVEHYKKTGKHLDKPIKDIIEENDWWLADEWSHVGYVIMTCLENSKVVDNFRKGNEKAIDVLLGKTLKSANMTVDPGFIRELIPLVITKYWSYPVVK